MTSSTVLPLEEAAKAAVAAAAAAAAVAAAAAGFCRLGGREVRRREDADCVLMAFYAH